MASASLGPAEKIQASIEEAGSPRAFLAEQRKNIEHTAETLNEEAFAAAANALAASSRVLLLGKGAARSLAELLRFRLARFGKEAVVLEAGSDVMEGLVRANAETVLLAFGFERVPAEVEVALAHLRSVSGRSILFTGRRLRESGADVELVAYRGEPRGYHSMASAVALIDALVVAVAGRMGTGALERLELLKGLKRGNEARLPR